MTLDELRDLYRYNDWANARWINALSAVPLASTHIPLGGPYASLRGVWAHIIGVEQVWFERWIGLGRATFPAWLGEDVDRLSARLELLRAERQQYLAALDPAALNATLQFEYIGGGVGTPILRDALVHCVNHGTHHRGQLALMMRMVEEVPPACDYIVYAREGRAIAS